MTSNVDETRATRWKSWQTARMVIATAFVALAVTACGGNGSGVPPEPPVVIPPLDTPAILSVQSGDGFTLIEWTSVERAASYDLHWSMDPDALVDDYDVIAGILETDYRHTGLLPGGTYFYSVRAMGDDAQSELSEVAQATVLPGIVEVLSISAGEGFVLLDWEAAPGAESYMILRSTESPVTPDNAVQIPVEAPPYTDTDVLNGTTYFYVVCAIGAGGEGLPSLEGSARPELIPTEAPTNVTVTLMEETIGTLVVSWDPPAEGPEPDAYHIFWSLTPGVDLDDEVIEDVESPFIHTGLFGQTTYFYRVAGVREDVSGALSAEVSGTPRGPPGGGGGGDESGFGNNLSFPVLFADGIGLSGQTIDGTVDPWLDVNTGMRPTTSDVVDPFPYFNEEDVLPELPGWYPQKTSSTWQADWALGPADPEEPVNVRAAWGDNLSSVTYSTSSVIRVETLLYQALDPLVEDQQMNAYEMQLLSGAGPTELQGTNTETYFATTRRVYTPHARLTIEKLLGPGGDVDESVAAEFDKAIYEAYGTDGPGGYGAEINVGGSLVYGYVWMLRTSALTEAQKVGWWRLTFSLDPVAEVGGADIQRRVVIDDVDGASGEDGHIQLIDETSVSIELQIVTKGGG